MKPIDWETLIKFGIMVAGAIAGMWAWLATHSASKKECETLKRRVDELEYKQKEIIEEIKINRRKINKIIERMIEKTSF